MSTAADHVPDDGSDSEISTGERPAFFRTISSISHASLAAAYQTMRAHGTTLVPVDPPLRGEPNQEPSVADGVIASGAGIPGAFSAYAETMADAGEPAVA